MDKNYYKSHPDAKHGILGDTLIAEVDGEDSHVNAMEMYFIDTYGKEGENLVKTMGSGTINPITGRKQYAGWLFPDGGSGWFSSDTDPNNYKPATDIVDRGTDSLFESASSVFGENGLMEQKENNFSSGNIDTSTQMNKQYNNVSNKQNFSTNNFDIQNIEKANINKYNTELSNLNQFKIEKKLDFRNQINSLFSNYLTATGDSYNNKEDIYNEFDELFST